MEGGGAVEHHRVVLDDDFQGVPNLFFGPPLHHFPGPLDVIGHLQIHQPLHHKGLKEFQGHLLGEAALVHLQVGSHNDNRTAGVVHALAQQVLAETPLLALEHIGEGF